MRTAAQIVVTAFGIAFGAVAALFAFAALLFLFVAAPFFYAADALDGKEKAARTLRRDVIPIAPRLAARNVLIPVNHNADEFWQQ